MCYGNLTLLPADFASMQISLRQEKSLCKSQAFNNYLEFLLWFILYSWAVHIFCSLYLLLELACLPLPQHFRVPPWDLLDSRTCDTLASFIGHYDKFYIVHWAQSWEMPWHDPNVILTRALSMVICNLWRYPNELSETCTLMDVGLWPKPIRYLA